MVCFLYYAWTRYNKFRSKFYSRYFTISNKGLTHNKQSGHKTLDSAFLAAEFLSWKSEGFVKVFKVLWRSLRPLKNLLRHHRICENKNLFKIIYLKAYFFSSSRIRTGRVKIFVTVILCNKSWDTNQFLLSEFP